MKLQYFQKRKWEAAWIQTAREIATTEYARYTASASANTSTEAAATEVSYREIYVMYSHLTIS